MVRRGLGEGEGLRIVSYKLANDLLECKESQDCDRHGNEGHRCTHIACDLQGEYDACRDIADWLWAEQDGEVSEVVALTHSHRVIGAIAPRASFL